MRRSCDFIKQKLLSAHDFINLDLFIYSFWYVPFGAFKIDPGQRLEVRPLAFRNEAKRKLLLKESYKLSHL